MKVLSQVISALSIFVAIGGLFWNPALYLAIYMLLLSILFELDVLVTKHKEK